MGSAIQSQTRMRLGEPLHHTGSLDPRFDRSSSRSALSPRHQRALGRYGASTLPSSRTLFVARCRSGPSRCSIPAKAARRFDCLQLAEVEIADCLQRLRGGALLQVGWQGLQPGSVFGLQGGERDNRVAPAMAAAAVISRAAGADQRGAGDPRGAVAGLAFGGGHGAFAKGMTGYRLHAKALRDGTASGDGWRSVT